jgi:hypothetical protein
MCAHGDEGLLEDLRKRVADSSDQIKRTDTSRLTRAWTRPRRYTTQRKEPRKSEHLYTAFLSALKNGDESTMKAYLKSSKSFASALYEDKSVFEHILITSLPSIHKCKIIQLLSSYYSMTDLANEEYYNAFLNALNEGADVDIIECWGTLVLERFATLPLNHNFIRYFYAGIVSRVIHSLSINSNQDEHTALQFLEIAHRFSLVPIAPTYLCPDLPSPLSGIIRNFQHTDIKYKKPFFRTMLSFINRKEPAQEAVIIALEFLDIDSMEYLMAYLQKEGWEDENFMEKLTETMKSKILMFCDNDRLDLCKRVFRLAPHPAYVVHYCLSKHISSNVSFVNVCDCVGTFGEFYHIHRHYCPEGWNAPGRSSAQAFLAYFHALWKNKCFKALLRFIQQEDRDEHHISADVKFGSALTWLYRQIHELDDVDMRTDHMDDLLQLSAVADEYQYHREKSISLRRACQGIRLRVLRDGTEGGGAVYLSSLPSSLFSLANFLAHSPPEIFRLIISYLDYFDRASEMESLQHEYQFLCDDMRIMAPYNHQQLFDHNHCQPICWSYFKKIECFSR